MAEAMGGDSLTAIPHPTINRFQSLKILRHYDRLAAIVDGEMPYPVDWHIFPSNVCNHKCTWCMYRQNGEQFDFRVKLPKTLLFRAIRDAFDYGARLIHISGGGEPLLNKHTIGALELAAELNADRPPRERVKIAMSTNGRLLTPQVAALVDYLRVSLNAGTPEQHWKTNHGSDERDPGDWGVILENLRACVPYKRQDIGLGFVVDHENWRDIYPFCQVAADLGVDFVHIRPGFYYEPELDAKVRRAMPYALVACNDAKRDFGDKVAIYSITEKFDGFWTPKAYNRCRAVLTGVCLRATGDFAVCQDRTDLTFGKTPSYAMGATFGEVWHSQEHMEVVARIHSGAGGELDMCPRCVWGSRNNLIDAIERDDLRVDMV